MLDEKSIRSLTAQLNHDLREPLNSIQRKLELIRLFSRDFSIDDGESLRTFSEGVNQRIAKVTAIIRSLRDTVLTGNPLSEESFNRQIQEITSISDDVLRQIKVDASNLTVGEQILDYIRQIDTSAKRFQKMLRGLLVIAKLDEPTFVQTNFQKQAGIAAKYIEERLGDSGRQLEAPPIFTWGERASGVADQGMILSIFQNLYENSVKYRSARQLKIHTDIKKISYKEFKTQYPTWAQYISDDGDDLIHIQVSDNGIGIAPRYLTKVFEPYFQVKDKRGAPIDELEGDSKNIGIGLYTVRKMVNIHKGYIFAESDGASYTVFNLVIKAHPDDSSGTK
jgi:signal transduction histidine kinase